MKNFNYEEKLWGGSNESLSVFSLNSLKLKTLLDHLGHIKGSVIEVGCGGGGIVKAIKRSRPDLEVYGVDISKNAIEFAKKNSEGVNFIIGDIDKLTFNQKSFDAVVVFDVLEHIQDDKRALTEIKRILKPKGILSLFVPLDGSPFTLQGIAKSLGFIPKKTYAGHVHQYSEKEVINLLKESGFLVKEKKYTQYLFHQFTDLAYFTFLYLRRKNFKYSVESYIEANRGAGKLIILFLKSVFSVISFLESKVFAPLPGLGLHVKAVKIS